jgi:hypothetical protein
MYKHGHVYVKGENITCAHNDGVYKYIYTSYDMLLLYGIIVE